MATALLSFTPLIMLCRLTKSFPAFHDLSDSNLPVLMAQSNVPCETVLVGVKSIDKVNLDLSLIWLSIVTLWIWTGPSSVGYFSPEGIALELQSGTILFMA